MKLKLSATQHRRLLKLLYMQYSPEEISCETDIPLADIDKPALLDVLMKKMRQGHGSWEQIFQTWLGISINSSKKVTAQA